MKRKYFNRKKILERDGYKCSRCGISRELCVHHIDQNSANADYSNLITLCRYCHKKTHGVVVVFGEYRLIVEDYENGMNIVELVHKYQRESDQICQIIDKMKGTK